MLISTLANNQFIFTDAQDGKIIFQSYHTIICEYDMFKKVLLLYGNGYGYSRTTSKYFNRFLDQLLIDSEVVKKVIKSKISASDGAVTIFYKTIK